MPQDAPAKRLNLELPSSFDVLDDLVEETESFFSEHVTDEDVVYRLVLLASEAVTNAIEHGNKLKPELKVKIALVIDERYARIIVEDEGEGFDLDRVNDPLSEDHLMDTSGRGVFLINSMADDVRWDEDGRRVAISIEIP